MDPTTGKDKGGNLEQEEIELLTPEEFAYLLAHGDQALDEEFNKDAYKRYINENKIYDD
jgi:hypothetical protein|tara:strand:+ start:977 stop:1153 length:177 start_codon:yes stop_codon:yes gene_type:complete